MNVLDYHYVAFPQQDEKNIEYLWGGKNKKGVKIYDFGKLFKKMKYAYSISPTNRWPNITNQ